MSSKKWGEISPKKSKKDYKKYFRTKHKLINVMKPKMKNMRKS